MKIITLNNVIILFRCSLICALCVHYLTINEYRDTSRVTGKRAKAAVNNVHVLVGATAGLESDYNIAAVLSDFVNIIL